MSPCIIIPIIVGLISAILGYLLGKLAGGNKDELNALQSKNNSLTADLSNCQKKLNQLQIEDSRIASHMAAAPLPSFNAGEAKAVLGKTIKENDLKVVEGIGPAIEELFHKHGIHTWKALGDSTVAHCKSILDSEGERFVVHNPGTWPSQAKLAAEGHWKELKDWQDYLKGGKNVD